MHLSDSEQKITTLVVRRFSEAQMPTTRKEIVINFKPHGPEAIHRLLNINVLRALESNQLIPTVVAFHLCGWTDARHKAESSFEMVVPILQRMYEITPESIVPTTEILKSDMEQRWPTVVSIAIWLGMYQCYEMGFVGGWAWEKQIAEVQSFRINEGIMGIDAVQHWEEYIQKEANKVERFLQRDSSRKFLRGLADLADGHEENGIPPLQWVELANRLGIAEDDRNLIVRQLLGEQLINRKGASDILTLTRPGIAEIQGQNERFTFEESAAVPSISESELTEHGLSILISHSSKDKALAEVLIELFRFGLSLEAAQIRCSSVDGYRLPAGVNTDEQLRSELKSARVLIGLLTPNSLNSTYVLFELGARWGAGLPMIPLLAGIRPEEMRGPGAALNAMSCETEGQLIQLVENIGDRLGLRAQSTASYFKQVKALMALSESQNVKTKQPSPPESLVFEESVYWKLKDGKREGPFCPVCFDERQKTIHLNEGATKGTYGCGICQNSFTTAAYKD